ncbi:multidrug efflux MFS transporter [Pseudolactococcus carnosus]|uniref:Multidrug efflux MFS transporter n=1 Tax=Pseudolactococcus carnosus TaxID=2749961 RepID=A0ABT0ASY4_9LACT|nr:multidrug efflux MFS transporter [Lactococcus carnosus]MCJ1969441.1 multidrug efflux MFS transporter [Lactococcus carnosus]MCJ1974015.1 multidrug efflux MFS transporter [Lactococcus carnosus]MCJ1975403.1 multidrug efflux MFS transporter [Lactococcus carnosus]MCJ1979077.1 multidrug efflux MFS transporter [Lactococcus carnosus]MCJ1982099.1 multidrug efflux MFS transporter [Lactococcus carnosus]
MEINWRRNLSIAWFGTFFTSASISLVMPFMALYVQKLGARGNAVELFTGLSIGISALASGLVAPIWGRLADQYGRRVMMIRASIVMTFTMSALAFVPNVWWLLVMRLLNGIFAGYIPNSTALIASQIPREKSGYALGILSTGMIGGSLIGPSIGGFFAQIVGMENVFLITGSILLLVTVLTIFFVKEDFTPIEKVDLLTTKQVFERVPNQQILYGLFITSFILQLTVQSVSPILTLYIRQLNGHSGNLLMISGFIVSAVGLSEMLSSGTLGKIGDKIGSHRLIIIGLVYSLVVYVPMAFVKTPLQLGILRFLLGFGSGALVPSVNSLLSRITPPEGISRIFSFNQMFMNFGQVAGPLLGSAIAGYISYQAVFIATSCFVLFNLIWSLFNFRKFLGVRTIES